MQVAFVLQIDWCGEELADHLLRRLLMLVQSHRWLAAHFCSVKKVLKVLRVLVLASSFEILIA